ncbi:hypothetical protein [Pontibacillus yanchengensis]|uniref:Uncharacterized protein n=1 Tax=Pontibacillus yanchengensis Y32 TaxID=1385514 RepID=A0A0A2TDW5_9BACI|nr:hypothetical protein [Pontibacillus yanchengensis]KGP72618.1 hypothetical protein N782_11520 [Pontibacillus yanchengensis Y32]
MRNILKISGLVILVFLLGVGFIVMLYVIDNPFKENEVKEQAREYLDNHFETQTDIYGVYNTANAINFDNAARVRHEDGTEFLVYKNILNEQMEDTYVANKWENQLSNEIDSYLEEKIKGMNYFDVRYDDRVGIENDIEPNSPPNFRNANAKPFININLKRQPRESDEETFNAFIQYLKEDIMIKHVSVQFLYDQKGPNDKEWNKSF